jgi:hypothetical protein
VLPHQQLITIQELREQRALLVAAMKTTGNVAKEFAKSALKLTRGKDPVDTVLNRKLWEEADR